MRTHAFSLVELSIVLVILGLLVGGILAGQSLIHAAELRKMSAFITNTRTAHNAFKDRYFALPGDFDNATGVWGRSNASDWHSTCSAQPGTPSATGTCNGDGNGWVTESQGYWEHLKLAGLIEFPVNLGQYARTTLPGANGGMNGIFAMVYNNNCCSGSLMRFASWI